MLTRPEVLNAIVPLFKRPRYLEIGVSEGKTFHRIKARKKIAVDPDFRFDHEEEAARRKNCEYSQVTSDEFFGSIVQDCGRFDLIYLDGLHTADQTLRDLLNAIVYLKPEGVIVIDDVKPDGYIASIRDLESFKRVRSHLESESKSWMGDVYKIPFFIDTFLQQFTYRTVSDNHGQAVIWRKTRKAVTERSISAVGEMDFEAFVASIDGLRLAPLADIVEEIRADLSGPDAPRPARAGKRKKEA